MTAILSKEQGRELLAAKPKRNKYGNRHVVIDGIKFDSVREGAYYAELKLREKAGEVADVELQKPFVLTINGQLIGTWRSDFAFHDNVRRCYRVIDVKGGPLTREFQRTRRLMRALHGIEIEVVR